MRVLEGNAFFRDASFPFHIHQCRIGRNEIVSSHTHDFVEFVYVVAGGALHEMADHRYALSPGDVFVLEPQTVHSYAGSGTEEAVVYNILLRKEWLQQDLDALLRIPSFIHFFYLSPFLRKHAAFVPFLPLHEQQRLQMEFHLKTIHDEFVAREAGYELMIKMRWIECLVLLSRFHERNRSGRQSPLSDEAWMDSILHFVRQHCRQSLSLQQMSRTSGMSVSSFTAKFKKATGMSFLDYKQSLQIRHACELLSRTDRKVADIALDAGFQDISFFHRTFRKHVGTTPRQYRESLRNSHLGTKGPAAT